MIDFTNKILLVDSESDVLESLKYHLANEGYALYTCTNGKKAVEIAQKVTPHLIILGLMAPSTTCKELRKIAGLKNSAILFLTSQDTDHFQIECLNAGADGFIKKPINPRVLKSQVKAILRRFRYRYDTHRYIAYQHTIQFDDITIDRETYLINNKGKEIQLPKIEFELFAFLAANPGKTFSQDEILRFVWNKERIVDYKTVSIHINKLRKRFGDKYIQTVRGFGYKFTL